MSRPVASLLLAGLLLPAAAAAGTIEKPLVLSGRVDTSINVEGRIVVLVDVRGPQGPDGFLDHAFVFSFLAPSPDSFKFRADDANLRFEGDRLRVTTLDDSLLVDLAIHVDPRTVSKKKAEYVLRFPEGIELIHREFANDRPMESIDLDREFASAGDGACASGGSGASSCRCAAGSGCSTECREGFFACCACPSGERPACRCVKS